MGVVTGLTVLGLDVDLGVLIKVPDVAVALGMRDIGRGDLLAVESIPVDLGAATTRSVLDLERKGRQARTTRDAQRYRGCRWRGCQSAWSDQRQGGCGRGPWRAGQSARGSGPCGASVTVLALRACTAHLAGDDLLVEPHRVAVLGEERRIARLCAR